MQKSEFGGCFHLQLFVLLTFWKFKSFLLPSLSVPLSWLPLSWSFAFRVLYYLSVKVLWCPEASKFTTISRSQEIQRKNSPDCFVGSHLSARYLNGRVALLEEIFWPTALAKGRTFDSGFRGGRGTGERNGSKSLLFVTLKPHSAPATSGTFFKL